VPLEILHLPFMLLGGVPRGKCPQVLAAAGFGIFLARVESILARCSGFSVACLTFCARVAVTMEIPAPELLRDFCRWIIGGIFLETGGTLGLCASTTQAIAARRYSHVQEGHRAVP
jgi:hypothetical protein